MANKWMGAGIGLVGGQVAGRLLGAFLSSRSGERLLERIDGNRLTPLEHRVLASRWSGNIARAISAVAPLVILAWGGVRRPDGGAWSITRHTIKGGPAERQIDWVQVLQRVAEVMLAAGAIFKVLGEFLEDRQKTAMENERSAAKRLA